MRIKQLSSTIANQIAAGEVIENPASVVKELLENALDAKANSITVDIGFGGLNHIKVADNGSGIYADDLYLAIAPNATSKLTQLDDLSTLTSMGFRGEALASIASISRLTLSSKPALQKDAMMLQSDGERRELITCARSEGTTIEVRDLFYNAPVRRRFLKSERSEYSAIEHVVKRFALSAPNIALHLQHNGKQILELPAAVCDQTRRLRIQKILGKSFIEASTFLSVEHANMRLTGWISGENYQRSQNDKQWIYLNQRMVKDKLLYHAFKQAYENKLYPGRHPACLLYLTIPSHEVDVNVHPTKHEVRFQQPRLVHDFIGKHINQAFMQSRESPPPPLTLVSTPMLLRENYIEQPKSAHLPLLHKQPLPWLLLNKQFGLITWNESAYLFNIEGAQQSRGLFLINPPLASRPLLVPISHEYNQDECQRLQHSIPKLTQFGIQLEIINTRVLVRTLPVILPQLNIKQMLAQVILKAPSINELPCLLIACQPTDPEQFDAQEKEALGDYIIQQLEQNKPTHPWCLKLDVQHCQEFMRA